MNKIAIFIKFSSIPILKREMNSKEIWNEMNKKVGKRKKGSIFSESLT